MSPTAIGKEVVMTARHILDENKRLVTEFYELAINRREPAEAARKYVELPYRQHNPEVADGESEDRNAAACLAKDSGYWNREPCPASG